jgi:two-component system osmolarity sensor histidine kinase EnvZ
MRLWPKSLVGRNALLIVGLMALAQLASAVLVNVLIVRPRTEQITDAMVRNVGAIRAGLRALPVGERAAFIDAFRQQRQLTFAAPGAASESAAAPRLTRLERALVRSMSTRLAGDDGEIAWRRDADQSLALRLRIDDRAYWLPLPGAVPVREFTGAWLAASIAAALLAVGGALAIQRRIERPLRELVRAAETLGRGARPEPLAEDGPEEIATVSRSFNQLVKSLDAIERDRALMLAGVSHDLRTPLTKLRLGVEILAGDAEAGIAASLVRSVAEMDAVIGQFLDFARVDDSAVPLERGSLDAIAGDVAAAFADQGQAIAFAPGDATTISMRTPLVRRAVVNLVENAVRHGRPPVTLVTGHDEAWAWVDVVDAGDGIAAADIETIKQPFRRAGPARSGAPGAGLGLAIVERVARSHGGELQLLPTSPQGLRARLRLPRSARRTIRPP